MLSTKVNLGGRKELFRALVGSHNYNLNTETSDKDYKLFLAPTFDDLYFNKQFNKSYVSEIEDLDCPDIRKISNLFWKANVNFLEVLFSNELCLNPCLSSETKGLIHTIYRHKEEIVTMNLPYLYNACIGMHITKKKQIGRGTEGTKYLIERYGYDTKQAMHSIRILDFLRRFADCDFNDFEFAIKYEDNDDFRELLLDIKSGLYSKDQFINISNNIFEEIEKGYKEIYYSKIPNEKSNENLINIVKKIVKSELD